MSEFSVVMSQFDRMCKASVGCINCPLHEPDGVDRCSIGAFINDSERIERDVMKWATEHPEPEYPTFAEWLNSIGVTISDRPFPAPNIPVYVFQVGAKMFEPIPADLAEKLGIEPKEG